MSTAKRVLRDLTATGPAVRWDVSRIGLVEPWKTAMSSGSISVQN